MFALSALLPLSLAVIASALPAIQTPADSDACSGVPGGLSDLPNFTLTAINVANSDKNASSLHPLVLGQAGVVSGAEFHVLSTVESYPYNDWPSLTLASNGISANSKPNATATVAGPVSEGQEIVFTTANPAPAPAPAYCFEPTTPGASTGWLAAKGRPDLFSLCTSGTGATAQVNVVFAANGTLAAGAYDPASCFPVWLAVEPLSA